jgi:hypothetical protein
MPEWKGSPSAGASAFPHAPDIAAWESPAIWRPERLPSAVVVAPAPETFTAAQAIRLDDLSPILASVTTNDGRHVLLADAEGYHQVWFVSGRHPRGSSFVIPNDDDRAARMHAVQRLERRLARKRSGPLLRSLQLSLHQRTQFTLQLRALDGVEDGASRREIAAVLLDPQARDVPAIEWTNAALRKRINRIIARATLMMKGGYLALLRGDADRAKRFRRR